MASAQYGGIRDMRTLAQRVHRRWLEYRRRNPGMSVPIGDTLSRILEHAPEYQSPRRRATFRRRVPLQNPGIFTIKEVATTLRTTVGDLLAEPGYTSIRDAISPADRRKLRDAVALLRNLFDLDDEELDPPTDAPPFVVAPSAFIATDHDYPEPLHAWLMAARGTIQELRDPNLRVVKVIGDSLAPKIRDGAKLVIDTDRTKPRDGDLVAVYLPSSGGVLGRWRTTFLERSNADPIDLAKHDDWLVWGTVTMIVETSSQHRPIVDGTSRRP